MDSSSLVSLIPRITTENSARRTLSSSKCLTRPLMFKQAILKPRLAGKTEIRHIGKTQTTWTNFVSIGCHMMRAGVHTVTWLTRFVESRGKQILFAMGAWNYTPPKRNEQEVNPAMYSKNITLSPLISRQLYCLRNCKICSGLKSERIYINESYTTCSLSTFFAFFSIKSLLTLAFVLVSVFRWYAAAPITGVVLARIACGKKGYFMMK